MTTDIIDLREFYTSPLGQIVQNDLRRVLSTLWPAKTGQVIVGLGYTLPLLESFDLDKNSVFALMPAQQGVLGWPSNRPMLSALVEEDMLPLPDKSVDRLLLVHALENCHNINYLLREAWRVLTSEGRLLLVVPNRRGLWARFDNTPFGHGQPYTMTQLSDLLRGSFFTPTAFLRGLYTPPSASPFIRAMSPLIEKVGHTCLQKFSGIVCIEAVKQVYAGVMTSKRRGGVPVSLIPATSGRSLGV